MSQSAAGTREQPRVGRQELHPKAQSNWGNHERAGHSEDSRAPDVDAARRASPLGVAITPVKGPAFTATVMTHRTPSVSGRAGNERGGPAGSVFIPALFIHTLSHVSVVFRVLVLFTHILLSHECSVVFPSCSHTYCRHT